MEYPQVKNTSAVIGSDDGPSSTNNNNNNTSNSTTSTSTSVHEDEMRPNVPRLLLCGLIALGCYLLPKPEELSIQAWKLLAIFVGTIIGIMVKPLPMGAVCMIGLTFCIATDAVSLSNALAMFGNDVVWLILLSFFIARGFIKTGLGSRLAYGLLALNASSALRLGYALVLTDLILSPAVPSVTARCGGIVFPIVRGLASSLGSDASSPASAAIIGSYLITVSFQTTVITSAMFMTAMAANPLAVQLAADVGVTITWGIWAKAAIVPGIVSLLLMPLVVYIIAPPTISNAADAPRMARRKLNAMGPMKSDERVMLMSFILLLVLWIGGEAIGLTATHTALIGLSTLLISGVLTWRDCMKEEGAWQTLIWFACLMMMASNLNKLGFTKYLSDLIASSLSSVPWPVGFVVLGVLYFATHYLFASCSAHVSCMYSAFLVVMINIGAPPLPSALLLGFLSSLMGGITHYGIGPAPVLFGSGYVKLADWWLLGLAVGICNLVVWIVVGGAWWWMLGLAQVESPS